jgi:hypothetical protein
VLRVVGGVETLLEGRGEGVRRAKSLETDVWIWCPFSLSLSVFLSSSLSFIFFFSLLFS